MALSDAACFIVATPTGRRSARGGLRSCRNFQAEIMLIRAQGSAKLFLGRGSGLIKP
jgi:hypothetical protein